MNLALSEEETLVAETAARIGTDLAGATGSREEAWGSLDEAGLLNLRAAAPADRLTATAARLVVENLAREVCPAPYLGHLLGAELLQLAVDVPIAEALPAIGGRTLAIGLSASLEQIGRVGAAIVAPDASDAGLVVALDADRPALLKAVPHAQQGIDIARVRVDGGDVMHRLAPLSEFGRIRWHAFALAMIATDLVGTIKGALALAVTFTNDRRQFGRAISSFQAIQHILADLAVMSAGADAATAYAAWAVDELDPSDALLAARVAKARASEAGRAVTEAVVQVHGGMGMTWECDAHRFLRRAALDRRMLGDELYHYSAIAAARRVNGEG